MNYAFEHEGKAYTPDGQVKSMTGEELVEHNKRVERDMLAWLETGPDKVFLYVNKDHTAVTTFLGTKVSTQVMIGPRRNVGFGGKWSYRRAVDCKIFGVRYVGWFMESSGDYCRLRKAKNQ